MSRRSCRAALQIVRAPEGRRFVRFNGCEAIWVKGLSRPLDLGHTIRLSAMEAGAGNCGEMCEVAFGFLKRIGASPLEMFACTRRRDHAFLVLGRPAAAQTRWIDDSWRDAVICDPWDDFTCVAMDDEDVMGRGVEFEVRKRWSPGGPREA